MPRIVRFFCYSLSCAWLSPAVVAQPVNTGLNPDRVQYARQVEQQATRTHDSLLLAEAWYLWGKTYVFAADYRRAQSYFLNALRVHEPRGDSFELSRLYVRLSENEIRLGRPNVGLVYAKRAHEVALRIHSDKALARSYPALAKACEALNKCPIDQHSPVYRQIIRYYQAEERAGRKQNDTMGVAEANLNMGAFLVTSRDPKAVLYLQTALALFMQGNKYELRIRTLLKLAFARLLTREFNQALQLIQQAETIYTQHKLPQADLRIGLEDAYIAYFTATRQWFNVVGHLQLLNRLEKRQLLADRDGAVTRLNLEYETEKKEALLYAQHQELLLQQRFIIVTTLLLLVTAGLSIFFFRLYRKNQRLSRQNKELVKEQNHRVKNNLQVVLSLLRLQSDRLTDPTARQAIEESQLRIQSIATLHQKLYDGEQLAMVALPEFIPDLISGVLQTFGLLQTVVQYNVDPVYLSADKATPLGLILNELATNACKYALPDTPQPRLWIACHRNGRSLHVEVADNGPGFSEGPPPVFEAGFSDEVSTFGMSLIQTQVSQLNGKGGFRTGSTGALFQFEFNY